jgi:hypothetical protein
VAVAAAVVVVVAVELRAVVAAEPRVVLVAVVCMAFTQVISAGGGPIAHIIPIAHHAIIIPIKHTILITAIAHIIPTSVTRDNLPTTITTRAPFAKGKTPLTLWRAKNPRPNIITSSIQRAPKR